MSKRSSIAIEPCPWGLSSATRRYMGTIPTRVKSTMSTVAMGERAPAASAAMPDMVAQSGEEVHAGQAQDLPPRLLALLTLPCLRALDLLDARHEQPPLDAAGGPFRGDGRRGHHATPAGRRCEQPERTARWNR